MKTTGFPIYLDVCITARMGEIMTTRIIGTGSAVPKQVVTNDDLAKIVDTSDEWIRPRTGIRERRIAAAESGTTDLAAEAARMAIEQSGIKPEELDIIVLATSSGDCCFPMVPARYRPRSARSMRWRLI